MTKIMQHFLCCPSGKPPPKSGLDAPLSGKSFSPDAPLLTESGKLKRHNLDAAFLSVH